MSTTPTTNYGWLKPVPGTEVDTWGAVLNTLIDQIDADLFSHLAARDQLSELTDVTITGVVAGQHLKYDGTKWVNGVGIVDTATAQNIALANDILTIGRGNNAISVFHASSQGQIVLSGGNAAASGANLVVNGATNAGAPSRGVLRTDTTIYFRWDPTLLLDSLVSHHFVDGTVALPGIAFTNDTDTGVRRIGANNGALVANGTDALAWSGTALSFLLGVAGFTATGAVSVDANLNVTGGILNVDRVGDAAAAQLNLKGDAGQVRRIGAYTGATLRWLLDLGDVTAEGGSNAGSDLALTRCNDAGSGIEAALKMTRSTGIVEVRRGLSHLTTQRNPTGLVLVNGANNDVAIPAGNATFLKITGPTGAFSITGIVTPVGDGHMIILYNAAAFAMTIANNNVASGANNRIFTLTGADVVLRAGTSAATLIYDGAGAKWILTSYN